MLKLLPRRLQELEAMTPDIQPQFSAELIAPVTPAVGERRYRVAMLTGCAQDLIFSDVNRDTVEVLARNGCEVVTPPEQQLLRLAARAQRRMDLAARARAPEH